MASKVKEYEKDIIKVIKKENIYSVLDIFAFYKGCSRATFYNNGMDKLDSIKDALSDNKVVSKQTLKSKWAKSDNATLQIALYKSICTDDERANLSQTNIDHTTKGDKIGTPDLSKLSVEDIEKLLNKNKEE